MNLELPLVETDCSPLDEHLAAIDRELDALFLDELEGVLQRLRPVPAAPDLAGVASA